MRLQYVVTMLLASVLTACATASPSPTLPSEASLNPDDAQLLQMIRDAGTDMSRPREIGHFMFFDTEEHARAAVGDVPPEYATEVYETQGWVMHASHTAVLNEDYLAAARPWWEEFALRHGTEYDGWDADADPPPSS